MFPPPDSRLSRRQRVRHLILLGLRLGMIVVFALLFVRVLRGPRTREIPVPPRRQLILIDASASMHRSMLWHAAQMIALSELHRARPGDVVALYTFDDDIRPLVSFAEWRQTPVEARIALAFDRLTAVSPGWGGSRLGAVLIEAASAMAAPDGTAASVRKQILVITDDRAGGAIRQLDHFTWPPDIELVVRPIQDDRAPKNGLRVVEAGHAGVAPEPRRIARVAVAL